MFYHLDPGTKYVKPIAIVCYNNRSYSAKFWWQKTLAKQKHHSPYFTQPKSRFTKVAR